MLAVDNGSFTAHQNCCMTLLICVKITPVHTWHWLTVKRVDAVLTAGEVLVESVDVFSS